MKQMFGYVPANLDLASEKHRDKFYFILTFIFYGRIFDKRKDSDSFIQLYSQFLKKILGRYKNYIQELIDMNVIETDNHYFLKRKFKGYRLSESHRNAKIRHVEIQDEKIISNYRNYKAEQEKKISEQHHKYIFNCLEQIEIDYEAAKDFLNKTASDVERYNSWNCSIDMIYLKDWFFICDKTAGRIHNNITNLQKDFRPFLTFKKQKLIEIDLRNSQPLLFNILINRYLLRYTDIKESCVTYIPYVAPDSKLYRELTEKGEFYEFMMEKLNIAEDRSKFKVRLFSKVFYGREETESWELTVFRKLFPSVSEVISHYKKVNYNNLAIELQRVEADIMINSIVPRLAEKKIFLLTIHDSILTTPDNVELVENVIKSEFKKFNLNPTLKIKK
jgi:hypothetical protein